MTNNIDNKKCIQCNKCLPCAADINIPLVVTFKDNIAKINQNDKEELNNFLNDEGLVVAMKNAAFCRRCNRCVRCCPANIDIPMEIIYNLSEYKKFLCDK